MKEKLGSLAVMQFIAITVVFTCSLIHESSCANGFPHNPADLYQIKKSVVWAAVMAFFLIIGLTQVIIQFNVHKRKKAENSLISSEEILRTLINGTPDLIFFKDSEGRYLEINDSMLELFGFDKESYKGKSRRELNEESLLFRTVSGSCCISDEEAWAKGSMYRKTGELCMPNGVHRTYDIIKTPIYYKNGKRKGIVTLARDITTYKETSEKLAEKEKILRATINATGDGILVVDNNRQILDSNDMYFNMWNIPWDIYCLSNEKANLKFIKKQILYPNTFEAWVDFTYKIPLTENYTAQLTNGSTYDIFSTPLMDSGNVIGRVWSFRDITANVNVKNELHKSEERYRTLVELSPDAIFVSIDRKLVFSNMAGLKMLKVNCLEDISQMDILEMVDEDERALTKKHFSDIINGKEKQVTTEHKLVRLDGSTIDIEAVCSIVPIKGENAVMCVVRDITERKRNEELRQKIDENMKLVSETLQYDKIKTEFFGNISHELKTPLNIIIGTLQLFELIINEQCLKDDNGRLEKYTSIMRKNCFRLLRMFNNLIYITEIDSGFVEMHVKNHDLVQILNNIMALTSKLIEGKGIKYVLKSDSQCLEIACDAGKIEKVVLNLLSNAVKFTQEGDTIFVSLYSDSCFAYISVRDTGIGIPNDMKEIIFQKFRQVDKSFTRNCEGSGIGLSLAKSLVEMHNGSIEVISEYGKGSEFVIKLPLRHIDNDEIAAAADQTANMCIDTVDIEFSDIY